jgi:translation initiation factor 1A
MYQSSIRDKKKHKIFNQQKSDNYELNVDYEEYAYVKKLLGNCRVHLITNSGVEAIGIIRGALKKFSKRVLIETGDIVVVSKRDYQADKVDIVHKYNVDQVQCLINEKKLSNILSNHYNNMHVSVNEKTADDEFDFAEISSEDDDINKPLNVRNPNRKVDESDSNSSEDNT